MTTTEGIIIVAFLLLAIQLSGILYRVGMIAYNTSAKREAGPPATVSIQDKDEQIEQLNLQLAGVSVVAMGGTAKDQRAEQGSYGWSPAYKDVLWLRLRHDHLVAELERIHGPGATVIVEKAELDAKKELDA